MTPIPAESVFLMSLYKPLLLGVLVGLWAYALAYIDKDLRYFFLPRQTWNMVHMGTGALGFLLFLLIPLFWIGLPLALLVCLSSLVGYHFYRNTKVKPGDRWRMSLDSFRQRWDDAQRAKQMQRATVNFIGADKKPKPVPVGEDARAPIHEALENLLEFALPRRAERIDMLADASQTEIVVTIDGVKYPQTKLEPQLGIGLIDYLKEHAGLDVQDRRRKLQGKVTVNVSDMGQQKFEITTSGTTQGVMLGIAINPQLRAFLKFDELGLLPSQKEALVAALEDNLRCVIAVAPPRHGLTTTLYSLVDRHDPYTQNIMTLEPEIALELEGVSHGKIAAGPEAPSLAQQLRTLLLKEPRIVLLSQLADAEAAKLIPPHVEEMRFYIGLRQADTFTALRAWAQALGDAKLAADSVSAIIAQRLIRKLCLTCRMAYQPDPAILKKLNLPADRVKQLYKHSGQVVVKEQTEPCPDCLGLGYKGRTAIFEVMLLDDAARRFIHEGQLDQARAHLRKNRMLYLQESALTKVVEGVTSISEITRVLAGEGKK